MKKFLLAILLIVVASPVIAADPVIRFRQLNQSSGLSNNQVNVLYKDATGFIWVGTMQGLNRYDGAQCRVFTHSFRDSTSLDDNFITQLVTGPDGNMWVQTRNYWNRYNPRTEKFSRDADQWMREHGVAAGTIQRIWPDLKGKFWILMDDGRVFLIKKAGEKAIALPWIGDKNTGVKALIPDQEGFAWVITQNGTMIRVNPEGNSMVEEKNGFVGILNPSAGIYNLFMDSDKGIWLYNTGDNKGIFRLNTRDNSVRQFSSESNAAALNNDLVSGIVEDEKGLIWICTDHGGINLLDLRKNTVQYIVHQPEDDHSLSNNSLTTAYKDRDGVIWIGTYKMGVSFYHSSHLRFPLFRHRPDDPRSLPYNDVNRFAEDAQGNLWIGTNGGGLIFFNRSTGSFKQYLNHPGDLSSISNNVIVSLCIDHQQRLWIGSYFGGLDRFENGKFIHYKNNPAAPGTLSDNRVWEIFEDSRKKLWIGTLGSGIDQLDRNTGLFTHYASGTTTEGPHSAHIMAFTEAKDGRIWIGTAYGIDVFDPVAGTFTHFAHNNANPYSLTNNNVIDLAEDNDGNIWVGTRNGVSVYRKKTARFQSFKVEHGLPDNVIQTIRADRTGRIWVSTPNGLARLLVRNKGDELEISCQRFSETDGLQGRAFNENAALVLRSGELVFGGPNGFNFIDPAQLHSRAVQPPVVFTGLQIFNRVVNIGDTLQDRVVLPSAIPYLENLRLKHNENILTVSFTALHFSGGEQLRYAYLLEGFNKEWIFTDEASRKVTFTNLDPGTYQLRIRTAGPDGNWNNTEQTLAITILPPFWKTPLAYLLYAAALVGILWLARRRTLQRARLRFEREQEQEEAKRLHELDLMKIRFFTNVSHEFRTPISLILTPAEELLRTEQEPRMRKQFDMMYRNARRLLNLVNQLLDFRRMEVQELKLNISKGDVVGFVKETAASFSDMAEKKGIRFTIEGEAVDCRAALDFDKMERILFNLLSNAFKFTPAGGEVRVMVAVKNAELLVEVTDTGIGIPLKHQANIFERFFQHETGPMLVNQGSGIGLAITKEFVRMHGGHISVESEPDKGSCFRVNIPIDMEELPEPVVVEEEQVTAAPLKSLGNAPLLLLVEDNDDFRFYLKDNLQPYYRVVEAVNGKEGWQKALSAHPDLIVSDVSMPVMNGIEFCHKIKGDSRTSHIPIILLTALTGEEEQLKGLETGAADYLTKPFNVEILLSKVKNLVLQHDSLRKTYRKQLEVKPASVELPSSDELFLQQVTLHLEEKLMDPDLSVESLSKSVYVSRVSLYKKILVLTGKTPIEFIRDFRLERAAQLLATREKTVSEVAYEVGFSNPKIFSRYFKAKFGVVPSNWTPPPFQG